ncbi:MAG: DNA polymerase III subunit beta [Candidatus Taylorbacteria bacterium CG11_big_fil_rev_8_21_14_0_20_46_11]|uniref:Beta sliding clamp n=1 Tax=Candidatus Taylorbacteria bacterium CG11_big_fil_rev_8_21_14_0_20_46_11 TaxID=1975025 RepID=A0A2H0KBU4_9BACT|nr:MAG: DNA polymerase III subunit beta [Candidatus Taylorbacteria bacterium CG11_big_fil_rev_8_21_14_0_20_46_11]
MKIEVIKEKLQIAISKTERFSGKHLSLPILSHLLLIAKNGTLTIRSTNLDMGVEYTFPVKIEREGVVAVPATVFSSFVSNLRNAKNINIEQKEQKLHVSSSGASALINIGMADDFPTIPKASGSSFLLDPQVLVKGFRSVQYAGAVGNLKPELSSVYVYHENEDLVFVATDSFRLAEKKVSVKKGVAPLQSVLVPVKNAGELVRLLDEEKEDVRVSMEKGQLSIEAEGFYVTTRLVEGSFPDYRQIIPKEFSTEVVALREDVAGALKITTLFSDRFNQLRFKVDPEKKEFILVARNGEVGESTEGIPAALTGAPIESNFNYRYVGDCLSVIGGDSVSFRFSGENKPLLIGGVGDRSFQYLVMPMNR